MVASVRRQNFYSRPVFDARLLMTVLGVEFEFEWQVAAVPAGESVFLLVQTPTEKYTVVNFREVRHNQTFGFYRQYRQFDDSGATLGDPIAIEPMRGDTDVPSAAIARPITGVVVDVNDAFSNIPLWGAAGQANRQGAVVLLEFENQSLDPAYWYAYFKQWEAVQGAIPEPNDL